MKDDGADQASGSFHFSMGRAFCGEVLLFSYVYTKKDTKGAVKTARKTYVDCSIHFVEFLISLFQLRKRTGAI